MRRSLRPTKTGERGYVLILVLAIIVILTAAGAALYRSSESQRWALGAVASESLAASRANAGAQWALGQLRANGQGWLQGTVETCDNADALGENSTFPMLGCRRVFLHQVFNTAAVGVDADRETGRTPHVYTVRVYERNIDGVGSSELNRLVIDSIGYVGTRGTDGFTSARVELEVEWPLPEGQNHVAGGS